MKNSMICFGPLPLGALLLCMLQFHHAEAAERHVPAQYATIQQAVNAAGPGDTVRIAAGNYTEQIVVSYKTGLTLAGEPGAVLHAFPGMIPTLNGGGTWPYLAICGVHDSDIVVSGLHFEGESLGSTTVLEGLSLHSSSAVVTNCTFSGFRAAGTPAGNVGWALWNSNLVEGGRGPLAITIADCTFTNNQTAIRLGGDPSANPTLLRLTVKVHRNTIRGFGPSTGLNRGILIICGVSGDITENIFTDFATASGAPFTAYDTWAQSHARFVPMLPLNLEKNTFTNNAGHLFLLGNSSRIINNTFSGGDPNLGLWGALVVGGTNAVVANNNFSDMQIPLLLISNESWPSPWPALPPATNPSLIDNWFCNVPEPIRYNPLITVLQEQGTETNCLLAPRFQSIAKSINGETIATLRGWHGNSHVIEASTNLQNWTPSLTNLSTSPCFEFKETNSPSSNRFYRALKL